MTPIDMTLDGLQWIPLPYEAEPSDGLPVATHRGVLKIDTLEIECFRLSDGRAVISEQGAVDFFRWLGLEGK